MMLLQGFVLREDLATPSTDRGTGDSLLLLMMMVMVMATTAGASCTVPNPRLRAGASITVALVHDQGDSWILTVVAPGQFHQGIAVGLGRASRAVRAMVVKRSTGTSVIMCRRMERRPIEVGRPERRRRSGSVVAAIRPAVVVVVSNDVFNADELRSMAERADDVVGAEIAMVLEHGFVRYGLDEIATFHRLRAEIIGHAPA
jgi:hypothetical protein